jgi:hypothetical protein
MHRFLQHLLVKNSFVLALLLVQPAAAAIVQVVEVDKGSVSDAYLDLTGTRTFDIRLSTSPGEEIASQQIYLQLSQGQIIHHPLGSLTPSVDSLYSTYPALEFDTFFASGSPTQAALPTIIGAASDMLGSPNSLGPLVAGPSELDAVFGPQLGLHPRGVEDYLSIRLTLSDDAIGTFAYQVSYGLHATGIIHSHRLDLPISNLAGTYPAPEPQSPQLPPAPPLVSPPVTPPFEAPTEPSVPPLELPSNPPTVPPSDPPTVLEPVVEPIYEDPIYTGFPIQIMPYPIWTHSEVFTLDPDAIIVERPHELFRSFDGLGNNLQRVGFDPFSNQQYFTTAVADKFANQASLAFSNSFGALSQASRSQLDANSQTVPEPTTALLGVGILIGIAATRRRSTRSS